VTRDSGHLHDIETALEQSTGSLMAQIMEPQIFDTPRRTARMKAFLTASVVRSGNT
jgi:hypothetical protein